MVVILPGQVCVVSPAGPLLSFIMGWTEEATLPLCVTFPPRLFPPPVKALM